MKQVQSIWKILWTWYSCLFYRKYKKMHLYCALFAKYRYIFYANHLHKYIQTGRFVVAMNWLCLRTEWKTYAGLLIFHNAICLIRVCNYIVIASILFIYYYSMHAHQDTSIDAFSILSILICFFAWRLFHNQMVALDLRVSIPLAKGTKDVQCRLLLTIWASQTLSGTY